MKKVAIPGTDGDDWDLLLGKPSEEARAELFLRHRDYVFRLAWSFLRDGQRAEDVTQEVFLRLFRPAAGRSPKARFRTWLYQVTLNTTRETRRRHSREVLTAEPEVLSRRPDFATDPTRLDLARLLGCLPERQREAVVLRYLEGFSTEETARAMGCRAGTVKAHLHRGLAALRRRFTTESKNPQNATRKETS